MEPPNSFGEWLRRQRRALDLTQDEFAKRAGCATGTIRKIESDELRPSKQLAEILAQRLNVPSQDHENFVRWARGILREPATLPIAETASVPPQQRETKPTHNLPAQLTNFIGREKEITGIKRLLRETRFVTLTGAGGCGKSRLAIEVAHNVADQFPNGVCWVELAPLVDPVLVPRSIASMLGVREEANYPLVQTLVEYLRDKTMLLTLDNCEHVIEACAQISNTLLQNCPQLRILATSRESVGILGENLLHVPPLSLPEIKESYSLEILNESEAVDLFVDRAQNIEPTFALTSANVAVVAQICCELDGIPLAIELAAACVQDLSVEMIAAHLGDRFRLLTRGSRTALPHHKTLHALFDWSYDLLSEKERILLQRLAVFAGGWTLDAAEEVCSGALIEKETILDLHSSLVRKSLVNRDERNRDGAFVRYRMLETVRQFGRDKAIELGEQECIRNNHLGFFLKLVEQAESKMHGSEQLCWFERIDAERDNLQAALEWSQINGQIELGLRMMFPLFWYAKVRGYWIETFDQAVRLLKQLPTNGKTLGSAGTLATAGSIASLRGDAVSAKKFLGDSTAIARDLGTMGNRVLCHSMSFLAYAMRDEDTVAAQALADQALLQARGIEEDWFIGALLLPVQGYIAQSRGDYSAARSKLEESISLLQSAGDDLFADEYVSDIGSVLLDAGDYVAAQTYFERAIPRYRANQDKKYLANTIGRLGDIALSQGNYAQARRYYEESLVILRALARTVMYRSALDNLGRIARLEKQYEQARALHKESLALRKISANKRRLADSLEALGVLALAQGQMVRAARLLSASQQLFTSIGAKMWFFLCAEFNSAVADVRAQLDEDAFNAAWAEGQKMTLEQAIEYALAE
jgi:predicted ATPase/DNA-binding XRE family transcriptional regulator/predicted negative regulator of RcsB-dependent stress response